MRDFRFRLERRLDPEVLLAAVARRIEGTIEGGAHSGWRTDSRTDRSIVVSREAARGAMVRALEAVEGFLRRLFRGGRSEFEAPPPAHVEFLSAQVYPTPAGCDLDLRGAGRNAQRLGRELLRYVERSSNAELRRPATLDTR